MSDLEKSHVSMGELSKIISKAISGKGRLEQIEWTVTRTVHLLRGENFDIEIKNDPSLTPEAISDAKDIFAELKGIYWLK